MACCFFNNFGFFVVVLVLSVFIVDVRPWISASLRLLSVVGIENDNTFVGFG